MKKIVVVCSFLVLQIPITQIHGGGSGIAIQKVNVTSPKKANVRRDSEEDEAVIENFQEILDEIELEYKNFNHDSKATTIKNIIKKIQKLDQLNTEYPKKLQSQAIENQINRIRKFLKEHQVIDKSEAHEKLFTIILERNKWQPAPVEESRKEMTILTGQFNTEENNYTKGEILNKIIAKFQDLDKEYIKKPTTELYNYIKGRLKQARKLLNDYEDYHIDKKEYQQNDKILLPLERGYKITTKN